MSNHLVISAIGEDRPGIVNELTRGILEHGGNIADSRMTVLGGDFAVILLVSGNWNAIAKLEDQLPAIGERLGMTITTRRTETRESTRDQLPYLVDVVALDNPGIVHNLASFFSARNINIQDLSTTSYAAPHTGTPMFAVHMTVDIPARVHIATLREEFMDFCDQLNLDAVIEPAKG
ncbi:glycine cleavage system protein R [Thiohalobacter sp. IOR34]|uniref:glycine cleavage system protein R n=1 Tax=Thiohalobacter sp. IOR34 TaxID=3057176 RepID=UPI0025B012E3|nr:glycine cleavage system protein R [Thiohalobacter sp. IOR34]WJW76203.1 glycine cleavage system protein R [Thiohalobacter sp. IOR34]